MPHVADDRLARWSHLPDDDPFRSPRAMENITIAYGYQVVVESDDQSSVFHGRLRRHTLSQEQLLGEAVWAALATLRSCTESVPDKLSGIPVLRGTRFTLAQLLAELADGRNVAEIADAFVVKVELIQTFLHGLSAYLHRPIVK